MTTYKVTVNNNGTIRWYNEQGEYHRIGGPAIQYTDGEKHWYQNDKRHRLDGPASEYPDGTKKWCQNGQLHRTDGPAVEYFGGDLAWYQNGCLHRLDGPAIDYKDGTKFWWIEGVEYTEAEFNAKINPKPEAGKKVTVDGVEYTLV